MIEKDETGECDEKAQADDREWIKWLRVIKMDETGV